MWSVVVKVRWGVGPVQLQVCSPWNWLACLYSYSHDIHGTLHHQGGLIQSDDVGMPETSRVVPQEESSSWHNLYFPSPWCWALDLKGNGWSDDFLIVLKESRFTSKLSLSHFKMDQPEGADFLGCLNKGKICLLRGLVDLAAGNVSNEGRAWRETRGFTTGQSNTSPQVNPPSSCMGGMRNSNKESCKSQCGWHRDISWRACSKTGHSVEEC